MCGIAGIIGHHNALALTRAMMAKLAHRGPDGSGALELQGGESALGHQRLAILDLSDRGAQPMTSSDKRWSIVFNGEIFNYKELRQELGGVAWQSDTDTEVLLEAIARWGPMRAFQSAIGMFAVALWDHQERVLHLVRDRAGEKPLVYFHHQQTLAFASELKALEPLHDSRLHPAAVELYLALGYVPAPLAIYRRTHKLPAGHWLRFHNGCVQVERWWFPENAAGEPASTHAGRVSQLRMLLGDAVRLRLRADVPVALALSGGVDSSIMACEAARLGTRVDAFTVVFDQDECDLPFARQIARKYGLRHEVLRTEGSAPTLLTSRWQAALEQYDEPFADSSAIPSLVLGQTLQGRYKVILNGDGGDEAFAGYRHYEFIAAKQAVKTMAAAVGWRDGGRSATVYEQSKSTYRSAERARLLADSPHSDAPPDGSPLAAPRYNAVDRLLCADEFLQTRRPGTLKRALWSDRHLYLANNLTHKMDMALSAFGIEGRAPLLDHRILEWSQGLRNRDLVRGRKKKVLLRQAYQRELPPEVSQRPKHGFGAPIAAWLRGPLRERLNDLLPSPLLTEDFQREVAAGEPGQRLWTLLVFAGWARQWGARW